jgi:hypothetical protein
MEFHHPNFKPDETPVSRQGPKFKMRRVLRLFFTQSQATCLRGRNTLAARRETPRHKSVVKHYQQRANGSTRKIAAIRRNVAELR